MNSRVNAISAFHSTARSLRERLGRRRSFPLSLPWGRERPLSRLRSQVRRCKPGRVRRCWPHALCRFTTDSAARGASGYITTRGDREWPQAALLVWPSTTDCPRHELAATAIGFGPREALASDPLPPSHSLSQGTACGVRQGDVRSALVQYDQQCSAICSRGNPVHDDRDSHQDGVKSCGTDGVSRVPTTTDSGATNAPYS